MFVQSLEEAEPFEFSCGYLASATGEIEVIGERVRAREDLVIQEEKNISIKAFADSERALVVTRHTDFRRQFVTNVREFNAA